MKGSLYYWSPQKAQALEDIRRMTKADLLLICRETGLLAKENLAVMIVESGFVQVNPHTGMYEVGGESYGETVERLNAKRITDRSVSK